MKLPDASGPYPPVAPFTFLGLEANGDAYQDASVVVLPVPYDSTASFKSGAREGDY